MQKFADYIKKLFSKENGVKVVTFFKEKKRYIIAIVLFGAIVIILAKCTGPQDRHREKDTEVESGVEINLEDFGFKIG